MKYFLVFIAAVCIGEIILYGLDRYLDSQYDAIVLSSAGSGFFIILLGGVIGVKRKWF